MDDTTNPRFPKNTADVNTGSRSSNAPNSSFFETETIIRRMPEQETASGIVKIAGLSKKKTSKSREPKGESESKGAASKIKLSAIAGTFINILKYFVAKPQRLKIVMVIMIVGLAGYLSMNLNSIKNGVTKIEVKSTVAKADDETIRFNSKREFIAGFIDDVDKAKKLALGQ